VLAVEAFSGVSGTYPPALARFRASWAFLRGLAVIPGSASSEMAMLASSAAWLLAFLLAFNLAAFQPAQVLELSAGGRPACLSLLNRF